MARRIRRPYNAIERKDSDHCGMERERWRVRWLTRNSVAGSLFIPGDPSQTLRRQVFDSQIQPGSFVAHERGLSNGLRSGARRA